MELKKEKVERIVSGETHFIYPEEVKLQIVKELETGSISVKEVMAKYGIRQAGTVFVWLKRYSSQYRNKYMRVVLSLSERRQLAYKVESGVMSMEEATTLFISIQKYSTLQSKSIPLKSTMIGNFPFIKYAQYVYKTRDNNQEPS